MTTYTLPYGIGVQVQDRYTSLEGVATMFSIDGDGLIQVRVESNASGRIVFNWIDADRVRRRFIPTYDAEGNQTNTEEDFYSEITMVELEVNDDIVFGMEYECQTTGFSGGLTELLFDKNRAWAVLEKMSDRQSFPISRVTVPDTGTVPEAVQAAPEEPNTPEPTPEPEPEPTPEEPETPVEPEPEQSEGDAFLLPDDEDEEDPFLPVHDLLAGNDPGAGEPWEPGEAPAEESSND